MASVVVFGKRNLFSWRDEPLQKRDMPADEPQNQEALNKFQADYCVDRLCKTISRLPVMRGLVESAPSLRELPIYLISADNYKEWALGVYRKTGVMLNAPAIYERCEGDNQNDKFYLYAAFILMHELRHAFQCGLEENRHSSAMQKAIPAFAKVFSCMARESDATAFALTGMYELQAESHIFGRGPIDLDSIFKGSAVGAAYNAFTKDVLNSPENNRNGVAAQSAFNAYFSKDNERLLNTYVLKVRKLLAEQGLIPKTSVSLAINFMNVAIETDFRRALQEWAGMPSVDQQGGRCTRDGYLRHFDLSYRDVIRHIRPKQLSHLKIAML